MPIAKQIMVIIVTIRTKHSFILGKQSVGDMVWMFKSCLKSSSGI